MKFGLCPNCGQIIIDRNGKWIKGVVLEDWQLNNATIVPGEPFCKNCASKITDDDRRWIMACTRAKWKEEIENDPDMAPEEKKFEIRRISKVDFDMVLKKNAV